jgi:DNA-binding MarR family transcriptional regulator
VCTAREIRSKIDIDEGYLSRIIDKFIQKGLVKKTPAREDRRLHNIVLTEKGRREFMKVNDNSNRSVHQMIKNLSGQECGELVAMMERIEELFTSEM